MDRAFALPPFSHHDTLPPLSLSVPALSPLPISSVLNSSPALATNPQPPDALLQPSTHNTASTEALDTRWPDLDLLDLVLPTSSSITPPAPWAQALPAASANVPAISVAPIDDLTSSSSFPSSQLPPLNFPIHSPTPTAESTSVCTTIPISSPTSASPVDIPYDPVPAVSLHAAPLVAKRHALLPLKPISASHAVSPQHSRVQKQTRRYTVPKSSRYCHLCARHERSVSMIPCGNVRLGLCQKSVCSKCIATYSLNVSVPNWTCPHCCNSCPKRAKCFSYDRQTARRRERTLRAKLNAVASAGGQNGKPLYCVSPASTSITNSASHS